MGDEGDLRLIEIYKREGLYDALVSGARLLDSEDGLGRHGVQGWRKHDFAALQLKALKHGELAGTRDPGSGMDHSAHAFIRSAQVLALTGERE